jgi:hypothetical protein
VLKEALYQEVGSSSTTTVSLKVLVPANNGEAEMATALVRAIRDFVSFIVVLLFVFVLTP